MRAPYQHSPASQVHYLSIGLFGQVSAGYCFKQRQAARGASRGRIQLNPSVCPACSATALPQSCWKLSGSCTRGRTWACPYNPPQETTSQATKRDTVKARNILQQSQPPAGLIVMKTAMERESHSPVECPQCSHIFIPKQDCCTLQSTSNFAWTPRNAMAPTLHWCGLYCWAGGGSIWLGGCPAVGGGTGCQVEAVWDVLLLVKLKAYIIDSWIVWSPYEMLESSRSRWKLCLAVKFLNQRRGWTVDVGLHPSRSGVSGLDDIVRSAQCLENAHGGLSRGQPDPDEQDPSESSFTSHLHFDKNTLWTSLNNNMAFPYVGRRLAGMMVNELPGDIKRY